MKFSRQSRLLKAAEFKSVFQQPIRSGDESFRILARANGMQHHRLGMAVAKKACAKAVGRNRIKRVIRENFRHIMATQTPEHALDIVVLPTALATNKTNKALDESLLAHWQRLMKKVDSRSSGNQQYQSRTQR
jgi:ribonuclease P protein component